MKNILKSMRPYIIFNSIIFAVIGGFIGKNIVDIYNTRKRIDNDFKSLKKFIKEMGGSVTHIKLDGIDDDPKDPIDPTVIYVYD